MPESRERHRLRMQIQRGHPGWPLLQVKEEMARMSGGSQGSQKFTDPSQEQYRIKEDQEGSRKGSQENRDRTQEVHRILGPGMKEVEGKFEGTAYTAACPACRKVNVVDPSRSYRPVTTCVHFQQLREPGRPSAFLFNTRARALECPDCGYRTTDIGKMERHRQKYCPHRKAVEVHGPGSTDHRDEVHGSQDPLPAMPGLSSFGILYRKGKDDFTLVYLVGEKARPLRSIKAFQPIPELGGLKILREKNKEADNGI